ncbi:Utp14 protein-domain-containing protein [Tricladium varicosporioides]|nr:Utp14 protein-domain-containing protein [Hymenoscyphus varicosporioides]
MPGRQSHGRPLAKKSRVKNNSKKRALDAFSIASHQNPENLRVRQHRLGVKEGGNRPGKRRRDDNDEDRDDEEEVESKKQKKGPTKGRFDELDVDEGSDSEGNEWKMGQVGTDDDSDLDSDEAFGESDEERFEGFAFSGSSEKRKKSKPRKKEVNLDEDEEEEEDSELEEGDLGEGAVDLADMLDASSDEEEVVQDNGRNDEQSESDEDGDSEESDEESSASSADDADGSSDPAKIAALQSLIASLPQNTDSNQAPAKQRSDGASEYNTPSDFGLISKTKLTLEDLGLPAINDPHIKKSLKFIESDERGSKNKKLPAKLEVPLAKRQQDRLDRSAAYEKSKETLDRWTDTVKHNRRAEHLMFPLQDNDIASAHSNKQLLPTNQTKPFNELEATIQSILEESGLAAADGKDDEDRLREFEELETKKMSIEEVKARRNQLRMARDLLFREETKAKRIKKIKSKSYRKVHRKQREKEERLNQEALEEGGYIPSEDELEKQDRRRAEERMGAKHRGSKWAKATKATGRAAWDEDARAGITEMARRDEELRKRVEGKAIRKEFDEGSEASFSESESESEGDSEAEESRLLRKLDRVGNSEMVDNSLPGAKLANMKFMKKAEESRRRANNTMAEDIRKELAGEQSGSEVEEAGDIGRRLFGPGNNVFQEKTKKAETNDFEEPKDSDEESDEMELDIQGLGNSSKSVSKLTNKSASNGKPKKDHSQSSGYQLASTGGAWSKAPIKRIGVSEAEANRRRHKNNSVLEIEELDLSKAAMIATQTKPTKNGNKKPKNMNILEVGIDSDESNDESTIKLPFAIRDQELIKRAFAGADVVGEFEAEKRQIIEDEDEKVIDETLPGWGSWTGEGVSKREKAKGKGKVLTKVAGVKEKDRKDSKLDRVIINEKRVKKNGKYLASSLPHPFETRQQYERSLRVPVGPEWTTKETHQESTKPRILLKQGIIAPMAKPLM